MIKEAYCSFEVAKLLKEKGFDEYCRYFYDCDTPNTGYLSNKGYGEYIYNSKVYDGRNLAACPTHQMAMAWLREVHCCHIVIDYTFKGDAKLTNDYVSYVYQVENAKTFVQHTSNRFFNTYEEAVEAAIKHCLENLI